MQMTRSLSIDGTHKPPEPETYEDPATPGIPQKVPEHPLQNKWYEHPDLTRSSLFNYTVSSITGLSTTILNPSLPLLAKRHIHIHSQQILVNTKPGLPLLASSIPLSPSVVISTGSSRHPRSSATRTTTYSKQGSNQCGRMRRMQMAENGS